MLFKFKCLIFDVDEKNDKNVKYYKANDLMISGNDSIKKTGLKVSDIKNIVFKKLEIQNIKLNDKQFDIFASSSGNWINENDNILDFLNEGADIIFVSRKVQEIYGNDSHFYNLYAQRILYNQEDIYDKMSRLIEELLVTIKKLNDDEIDWLNRIITINPTFMGIGVNINELVTLIKSKILKIDKS